MGKEDTPNPIQCQSCHSHTSSSSTTTGGTLQQHEKPLPARSGCSLTSDYSLEASTTSAQSNSRRRKFSLLTQYTDHEVSSKQLKPTRITPRRRGHAINQEASSLRIFSVLTHSGLLIGDHLQAKKVSDPEE